MQFVYIIVPTNGSFSCEKVRSVSPKEGQAEDEINVPIALSAFRDNEEGQLRLSTPLINLGGICLVFFLLSVLGSLACPHP